jgi:TusA-related sulfurtransferase
VARKALEEMRTGQVGEVLITNPPSLDTVPRVIGKDSTLLGTVKNGDMWRIYFRKGE